jgi:predicted enzyme related to lactoylglutathione lyase
MDVPGGSKILHAIDPQGASFALMTPQTEEVKQP